MKRDMDLVRELLLKIADADDPPNFSALVPDHKEDSKEYARAACHMHMLVKDAGFVRAIDVCSADGDDWLELQLTWAGQDFLDNIRDPAVWKKTKEALHKIGGASWDVVAGLGKAYVKAKVKEHLGLDL
jgi:hypothetical protein